MILIAPGCEHGTLTKQFEQLNDALNDCDSGLYLLGEVVVDANPRATSTDKQIETVNHHKFSVMAQRQVDFFKVRSDGIGREINLPTDCPERLAKTYLSMRGELKLPRLRAVVNYPTVNISGKVQLEDGYDPDAGILHRLGGLALPDLPLNRPPNEQEVNDAKAVLREPYQDFPFVGDDWVSAIALQFSAMHRPNIMACPAFGFTAPSPRTGRSLVVAVASCTVTGQVPGVMNLSKSREENEKRIGGLLLQGNLVNAIDNVSVPIEGDQLCSGITEEFALVRPLGTSELMRVENSAIWTFSGNGLKVNGDMSERLLLAELDAKMADPGSRATFALGSEDTLKAWVIANRPRLLWAMLILELAYHHAGRPDIIGMEKRPPMGGFDLWESRVRNMLLFHGYPDLYDLKEKAKQSEAESSDHALTLQAWRTLTDGKEFTAATLKKEINSLTSRCSEMNIQKLPKEDGDKLEAVQALEEIYGHGAQMVNVLGHKLRCLRDHLHGRWRLRRVDTTSKMARWIVEEIPH